MMSPTQTAGSIPQFRPLLAPSRSDDLSTHGHRLLIGVSGLLLPLLLWVVSGLRHTEGLPSWETLGSVCAYYYTGAAAVFVGTVVSLAVFLFTYRGYDNVSRRLDRIAAIIAGFAAMGVAFFPTEAPSRALRPEWWTTSVGVTHYISAVILFGSFIFFSLFLFPKSILAGGESPTHRKLVRNRVYRLCGFAMVVSVLWLVVALLQGASIFWPEVLALEFFGVSWLVKGHADWTAVGIGQRALHYSRHPGQLARQVRAAARG